jgi:hypothetical protein
LAQLAQLAIALRNEDRLCSVREDGGKGATHWI